MAELKPCPFCGGRAIMKITPTEKGEPMDDLISRDDLMDKMLKLHGVGGIYLWDPEQVQELIELAPTVDAVEPAHGEWEFGELGPLGAEVKCTNCGWGCENVDPVLWIDYPGHRFCGACGAKMDGDGNG